MKFRSFFPGRPDPRSTQSSVASFFHCRSSNWGRIIVLAHGTHSCHHGKRNHAFSGTHTGTGTFTGIQGQALGAVDDHLTIRDQGGNSGRSGATLLAAGGQDDDSEEAAEVHEG
jgi:hypothetical protein